MLSRSDACEDRNAAERGCPFCRAGSNRPGRPASHRRTGLMSTTGVLSIASMGPMRRRGPSMARTVTGWRPQRVRSVRRTRREHAREPAPLVASRVDLANVSPPGLRQNRIRLVRRRPMPLSRAHPARRSEVAGPTQGQSAASGDRPRHPETEDVGVGPIGVGRIVSEVAGQWRQSGGAM
jgi:hypothetical protein